MKVTVPSSTLENAKGDRLAGSQSNIPRSGERDSAVSSAPNSRTCLLVDAFVETDIRRKRKIQRTGAKETLSVLATTHLGCPIVNIAIITSTR